MARAKLKLSAKKRYFMRRSIYIYDTEDIIKTTISSSGKHLRLAKQHLTNISNIFLSMYFKFYCTWSIESTMCTTTMDQRKRILLTENIFSLSSIPVYIGHSSLFCYFLCHSLQFYLPDLYPCFTLSFLVWNSSMLLPYQLTPISFYITSCLFLFHT